MTRFRFALLIFALALVPACATAPPTLSPAAQAAFQKTEVIHALDLLRDTAIDAEAATLLSTPTTRLVVNFHKSSLQIINVATDGWRALVSASLKELERILPAKERDLLRPYLTFALERIGS